MSDVKEAEEERERWKRMDVRRSRDVQCEGGGRASPMIPCRRRL